MPKHCLAIVFTFIFLSIQCDEFTPSHIKEEVWEKVKKYVMTDEHPAKKTLDAIFETGRPSASVSALKKAGFKHTTPRTYTRVIVAAHPKLPHYLLKIYTDKQSFHKDQPEWQTWLNRIHGAKLIKYFVKKMKWDWFTVPKKWMYMLPNPDQAVGQKRKDFILIVEKMPLLSERKNEEAWGDKKLSKELLKAMFHLVTALGLRDCAKPANAPFCEDGKIAFIDTEIFCEWPIEYHKLTQALSLKNKGIWHNLIKNWQVTKLSKRKIDKVKER